MKGAYFRLLEDKSRGDEVVEYRSGEKSEMLIVDGESYGQFSVFVFVLKDRGTVRNYVDRSHPVVITLNGQNHGEMTSNILAEPKPAERQKKRTHAVRPEIIFCAPEGHDREELAEAIAEKKVGPFGPYLEKYRDALGVGDVDCAYWGQASERDGSSLLTVEINVTHPRFQALLKACPTPDELTQAKERVVKDIVLDCYQHCFRLDDVPEIVHEQVVTEPEDLKRAAEICLNYDKALRMAMLERKIVAKTR